MCISVIDFIKSYKLMAMYNFNIFLVVQLWIEPFDSYTLDILPHVVRGLATYWIATQEVLPNIYKEHSET